jgi:hypothetical protein
LKTETTAAYFQKVEKFCCVKLRLKIDLRTGIKISEQHFITNADIMIQVQDHL